MLIKLNSESTFCSYLLIVPVKESKKKCNIEYLIYELEKKI